MAYRNPETGRIYLTMKMAPVCMIEDRDEEFCETCPVEKVRQNHPEYSTDGCSTICQEFGDEVAKLMGYEIITFNNRETR